MRTRRLFQPFLPGVLAAALVVACTADGDGGGATVRPFAPSEDPAAQNYVGPALPHARVILEDAFGGSHLVDVEVAATAASRQRGLMWRTELPEGKGMLFIFPQSQVNSFWMRNTLIPLDMVFIDKGLRVVGVVQWAEPQTLTSRTVGKPSLYVLEVPGGWASRNGVRAGSTIELEGALKARPGQP